MQMLANKSKSVAAYGEDNSSVFASDKEDAGNASPLKQSQLLNKAQHRNSSIVTPMKPGNRSTGKAHLMGGGNGGLVKHEDLENDASFAACSSGKNSRRKASVTRLSRGTSQQLESKACNNNAPRKKAQRPASARYL